MQSSMGDRLKNAAATPSRELEFQRALRRGLVQRVIALAVAMLGLTGAVVGAAIAYPNVAEWFQQERGTAPTSTCELRPSNELTAFLVDDSSEVERATIRDYLHDRVGLASFDYVSRRAALEEFKDIYSDQPAFWRGLPRNTLPASFRIELEEGAPAEEIKDELAALPGIEMVTRPRAVAPDCDPRTVAICPPNDVEVETRTSEPKDGTEVDHFGVYLEISAVAQDPSCVPTLYVEVDGAPIAPPDGNGTDALEFIRPSGDLGSCTAVDWLAGNLLYSGRHTVGVGTGCDPASPGPHEVQRTFEFDGGARSPAKQQAHSPEAFCDHAANLDELRRPPTDDELDDLLASAPEDIREETAALVESARQFREGNDAPSMTDEVQEAADRFDEYVAENC